MAQAMRPLGSPLMPQSCGPAIAATTSNPWGRPSSRGLARHGPPASATSIRTWSGWTSARRVNSPPSREALCRTELVAYSDAIRMASSARGQSRSRAASATRAWPDRGGAGGEVAGVGAPGGPPGAGSLGVPDLGGVSGEGAGVVARARPPGCRGHLSLPGQLFVFPSLAGEVYVGNRIGLDAH